MAELADAHRAGRRLYIGTTEEEGKRFIVWDIGAIACRNGPGDRDLMIDVLIGSAAIPGVFPPSKIDVFVDGRLPHRAARRRRGVPGACSSTRRTSRRSSGPRRR